MHKNLRALGLPPFDDADRAFARQIQRTLSTTDIEAAWYRVGMPARDAPLCDEIVPLDTVWGSTITATDVGDVSWLVPTAQAYGATHAIGTPDHSWQLVAEGKSPAAHKGLVHVAKAMAATAVDAILDDGLIRDAKAELIARTRETPYQSLLPDDLAPPFFDAGLD